MSYRGSSNKKSGPVLIVAAMLLLAGCSLVDKSSRPTPGAPDNLVCALEYRPDPSHEGPDVLFVAASYPYRGEEFYMSLPDVLLHAVFAPGRHLTEPVRVRGARCEPPFWEKGHRLPRSFAVKDHYLLCRRDGLSAVEIEVKTKWGSCVAEIPEGDAAPRCRRWGRATNRGLRWLSQEICSPSS